MLVEPDPAASTQRQQAAATELVRATKEAIGVTVDVEVREPGSLERSTGKLQRVIDDRNIDG